MSDDFEDVELDLGEDESQDLDSTETTPPEVDNKTPDTTTDAEDTTKAEGVNNQVEIPKIKVKFNHEEKELTLDEVTQLAQKGMNYDKVHGQVEELKNNKGLQYLERLAKENNSTVDDMVTYWQEQEEIQKIKELAEKNGLSEELANRLYTLEKRDKERETQEKQTTLEKQKEEAKKKEYVDFIDYYKKSTGNDLDINNVPKEIWESQAKGKSLTDAYIEYENTQLKNEIKILKQNLENSSKANVATTTTYGDGKSTIDKDLLGWDD